MIIIKCLFDFNFTVFNRNIIMQYYNTSIIVKKRKKNYHIMWQITNRRNPLKAVIECTILSTAANILTKTYQYTSNYINTYIPIFYISANVQHMIQRCYWIFIELNNPEYHPTFYMSSICTYIFYKINKKYCKKNV